MPLAVVWLTFGVALVVGAWLVPVNLKSITPALLREAGRDTPSVAQYGRQLLESEKLGSAQLFLAAARLVNDPGASVLDREVREMAGRRPEWVAWGGWDPFLDPLFNLKENSGRSESTPVLTFFVTEKARRSLRDYLANSRSLGVQTVLQTKAIGLTAHFVPATRAGGQTLDATVLLTALLYQSENLSPSLQREVRALAQVAVEAKAMGDLELFYLDLLALGKRLNWTQLCELLRAAESVRTVGEYAHLSRVAPDNLPLIYSAALLSHSADKVATYLIQYGKNGVEDLRLALERGRGAVEQLLYFQQPVNREAGPALSVAAQFGVLYPRVTLIAKYLGFLLGAFCLFRGLECAFVASAPSDAPLRLKSGVLATLIAAFLILATEPFLLKSVPISEFRIKLVIPVLANISDVNPQPPAPPATMDKSTLISIAFFAALQVIMYLFCLLKIRDIARQPVSPMVKLRLMENEENLFDGGLYIGIGGTATALVLQVLGLINPNLLAAYSSNLFGITCVAMVKIRHVRIFKRQLILEGQSVLTTATPGAPAGPSTPAKPAGGPSSAVSYNAS